MTHLSDFIAASPDNSLDTDEAIAGRAAALEQDQKEHWAVYYAPLVAIWPTIPGATTDDKLASINAKLDDDGATPWWQKNNFSSPFGYPDIDAAGGLI